MPPKTDTPQKLLTVTLAAIDAGKSEDWSLLKTLLRQRAELIATLDQSELTPEHLEKLKKADILGQELSAYLLKEARNIKSTLAHENQSKSAVKHYKSAKSPAAYNLTG